MLNQTSRASAATQLNGTGVFGSRPRAGPPAPQRKILMRRCANIACELVLPLAKSTYVCGCACGHAYVAITLPIPSRGAKAVRFQERRIRRCSKVKVKVEWAPRIQIRAVGQSMRIRDSGATTTAICIWSREPRCHSRSSPPQTARPHCNGLGCSSAPPFPLLSSHLRLARA